MTGTATEAELLQQEDPATDTLQQEEVLDYIRTHCQEKGQIKTQDLHKAFVQTGEIAKASLYRYLRRWQQQGVLHKPRHGVYTLNDSQSAPETQLR